MKLAWSLPVWGWLLIALVCLATAAWAYHRLQGPRWIRAICAALRGLVLLSICLLLAEPQRVETLETKTPYRVGLLIDTSASMTQPDILTTAPGTPGSAPGSGAGTVSGGSGSGGGVMTRAEAVALAAEAAWGSAGVPERVGQRPVQTFALTTTADGRTGLALPWSTPNASSETDPNQDPNTLLEGSEATNASPRPVLSSGGGTRLGSGVGSALGQMVDGPIGAVVLVSDGRSQEPVSQAWLDGLKRRGVPVVVVPVGPEEPLLDIAIDRVVAPKQAQIGDPVPVTVRLKQLGGQPVDPASVTVSIIDAATGQTLAQQTHDTTDIGNPLELRLPAPGSAGTDANGDPNNSAIEAENNTPVAESDANPTPESTATLPGGSGGGGYEVVVGVLGEKVKGNNRQPFSVVWTDEPLQVLYVESYPRWEYRYLANALTREASIESSMLLLAAARAGEGRYVQEGNKPIQRMPNTARELAAYDVVVLGDVPVSAFSDEQLAMLRKHIADEGAGLVLIGGQEAMPSGWGRSPLAALLPMADPAGVSEVPMGVSGQLVRPTEGAQAAGVFRLLGPDNAASDDTDAWPNALSPVLYAQNMGPLKPSVSVWATRHPFDGAATQPRLGDGQPLVTQMPFGAGQVVYVGTDEFWRFRRGRGGVYFEPLWIQMVRTLGLDRVRQTGTGRASLTVSSPRLQPGDPLVVQLRLTDPALIDRRLAQVTAEVKNAQGQVVGEVVLRSESLPMDPSELASQRLEGTWTAAAPGAYTVALGGQADAGLAVLNLNEQVSVLADPAELADTTTDHPTLAHIAQATGGQVLALDALADLPDVLNALGVPEENVQTRTESTPLWHGYLPWGWVLGLLTLEWVLRKTARLV